MKTFKCVTCKRLLSNEFGDGEYLNPDGGVVFSGSGAYGSRFDLSKQLYIVLCDVCLGEALQEPSSVFVKEITVKEQHIYKATGEAHDEDSL